MTISVLMPTYNHQDYIIRAIQSVFNQQTSYNIELVIGNDCSPDKTDHVIRNFIQEHPALPIVYQKHEKNLGLLKNYQWLINHSSGTYLAILESDDYWIDSLKLEKQVSYLEKHKDTLMSCTGYQTEKKGKKRTISNHSDIFSSSPVNTYSYLLLRNIIKSPTVVFRKDSFLKHCDINKFIRKQYVTLDFPAWLTLANHGKIHYLSEETAFYSFLDTSLSNNKDLTKKLTFEDGIEFIRKELIQQFGKGTHTSLGIRTREAIVQARYALHYKEYWRALSLFVRKLIL